MQTMYVSWPISPCHLFKKSLLAAMSQHSIVWYSGNPRKDMMTESYVKAWMESEKCDFKILQSFLSWKQENCMCCDFKDSLCHHRRDDIKQGMAVSLVLVHHFLCSSNHDGKRSVPTRVWGASHGTCTEDYLSMRKPTVHLVSTPPKIQHLLMSSKTGCMGCTHDMPLDGLASRRRARGWYWGTSLVWKLGKKKILSPNAYVKYSLIHGCWTQQYHRRAILPRTKPCGGIQFTFLRLIPEKHSFHRILYFEYSHFPIQKTII